MNEKNFWSIVEDSHATGSDEKAMSTRIIQSLKKLKPNEIQSFQDIFENKLNCMQTWDFVNAMAFFESHVSDDTFLYWCCGVILKGQKVFEEAVKNVQSLAEVDSIELAETFNFSALYAFEEVSDSPVPLQMHVLRQLEGDNPVQNADELLSRYPTLAKRLRK